jgi:hypothetical protein
MILIQLSFALQKFEKIMRGIQGALIVASTLQIVVGFSGLWRNVARFYKFLLLLFKIITSCFLQLSN